ncbi:MAG: transposase [Candidatus Micrarchaeales archaeon]
MKIENLKNKIPEVKAVANVIVQLHGHTKKFAKHIVAFAIKQMQHLTDRELAEFVGTNIIGKMLGYKGIPHFSIFSKVRKRSDPEILHELYNAIIQEKYRGRQLCLIAQDGTDVPAHSRKDANAKWGYRTPSKREQENAKGNANTLFVGYKLHAIADAENEIPLTFWISPANMNEKKTFRKLFEDVRRRFHLTFGAKYLGDSAYDSSDVKEELRYNGVKPVIAINGRRFRKSETPKDPEYGRRWAIERIFSRLKEVFGLGRNRFIGIKRVTIHIYSCLLAYLITYLM